MKIILKILLLFLFTAEIIAREAGETEITTDDGIEVYQNEKYYLLKKNVKILSDSFELTANNVKVSFNKNLYDIILIEAKENVVFKSFELGIQGKGNSVNYYVDLQKLKLEGINTKLITQDIKMLSDGYIVVNNSNGSFIIEGINSKLINDSIVIEGNSIEGVLSEDKDRKEITYLYVIDENISNIKNSNIDMYAKKIKYDYSSSIIELIDEVTIVRNGEKISGDYGTLDTTNNSYKIKSNNKKKVRAIILGNE